MHEIKNPTISVVMPVYNAELYLNIAIESVLNQTFKDFELILINDGSIDNSLKIIKLYAENDSRIVIIDNAINKGLVNSLNAGLIISKGTYIARMDADDISTENRFQSQVDYLNRNKDIFLISGSFYIIDEEGKIIRIKQNEYNNEQIVKKIIKFGIIHHPTVMFRNQLDILYREKAIHGEDLDLWSRLITLGKKMYVSPDLILYYRIHKKSMSSEHSLTQRAFIKKVLEWHNQRLKTGKDEYDLFDPNSLMKDEGDLNIVNQKRQIKLVFLSDCRSDIIRDSIKKYWKENGPFSWWTSYLLYFICLLPNKTTLYIRKKIRGLWE